MSIRKYSLFTIIIYAIAFFLPAFFPVTRQAQITTWSYLLGAVFLILLYLQQTKDLSFEKKKTPKGHIFIYGFVGIFAAIFLQNIAIQIEQIFGVVPGSENTENIVRIVLQHPLFAIAAMIGGPIMEEFVFRRALVGFFDSFSKAWIGVIVSSLLFALIHQDGHLLLYFSLGCFFCLLYMHTGKIWTSILTHAGMNSLVIIVQILLQTTNNI